MQFQSNKDLQDFLWLCFVLRRLLFRILLAQPKLVNGVIYVACIRIYQIAHDFDGFENNFSFYFSLIFDNSLMMWPLVWLQNKHLLVLWYIRFKYKIAMANESKIKENMPTLRIKKLLQSSVKSRLEIRWQVQVSWSSNTNPEEQALGVFGGQRQVQVWLFQSRP